MFPLFLVIFGVGDMNKILVASFGPALLIVFNVVHSVVNARKTRLLAAKGHGRLSVACGGRCDLAGVASAKIRQIAQRCCPRAGDRRRGQDVDWIVQWTRSRGILGVAVFRDAGYVYGGIFPVGALGYGLNL